MVEALANAVQTLMRDIGLTDHGIERRKRVVGIDAADLKNVTELREIVVRHEIELCSAFFEYLAGVEEARGLLGSPTLLETARRLKREHLAAMVGGEYGVRYAEQRLELGLLYAKAGLDARVFLGAFNRLVDTVGATILKEHSRSPLEAFDKFVSFKKIAFFDIGLIVDVLVSERERIIRQQQDAIRELSTPVLQVRERMLLLPIIGVVDTLRARFITENLLRAIRAARARVVVVDVTGVATIDSKVANHLLQTVNAARLMGARVIVSGLSAEVAQALASLGIELAQLNTVGDLQGGLEEGERILGYRMMKDDTSTALRIAES